MCYLDDILVYSVNFEDHLIRLGVVFDRLRKFGLKFKPSKYQLFRPEVKYVGHAVTRDGVKADTCRMACCIESVKVKIFGVASLQSLSL